jgi:hypothetical protein
VSYTVPSVSTTSGKTVIILVNFSLRNTTDGVNLSGTAISSPVQIGTTNVYNTTTTRTELVAFRATGTGTVGGTVIVTPNSAVLNGMEISVVQLTGDDTTAPIKQSVNASGASGTPVTGTLPSVTSGDGEVLLAGNFNVAATWTPPGSFTELHDLDNADGGGQRVTLESSSSSAATTSATATPTTSGAWGAIAIEIAHA